MLRRDGDGDHDEHKGLGVQSRDEDCAMQKPSDVDAKVQARCPGCAAKDGALKDAAMKLVTIAVDLCHAIAGDCGHECAESAAVVVESVCSMLKMTSPLVPAAASSDLKKAEPGPQTPEQACDEPAPRLESQAHSMPRCDVASVKKEQGGEDECGDAGVQCGEADPAVSASGAEQRSPAIDVPVVQGNCNLEYCV